MNSAVAIWFSTLDSFDRNGCDGERFDFTPMNAVPIVWRYSGAMSVISSNYITLSVSPVQTALINIVTLLAKIIRN